MKIEVLGITEDLRTKTPVIYAQMSISDYLELVGDDFHEFFIQRKREKHRAYQRMKEDIVEGALLPSITLAVKPIHVDDVLPEVKHNRFQDLAKKLSIPGRVYILDGLQRTYILHDIMKEVGKFNPKQTIHVEFWLEKEIKHLIYRIIVLNAGQKPMSMRHQVELLFTALREKLERDLGIEILIEREQCRRIGAKKYSLDRVASAYHSFITKSPEVDKDNLVAQSLSEADIFDSSETNLNTLYEAFSNYFGMYSRLDVDVCRIYASSNAQKEIPAGTTWFGSENVMNAFFASVAIYGKDATRRARIKKALLRLQAVLESSTQGDDPIGLSVLHQLIRGINTRKTNLGFATRKLLSDGFREYFRDEGDISISQCWLNATE